MQIAITHLTRMGHPYICAAGIDKKWRHWRPVAASRKSGDVWKLDHGWLRSQGGLLEVGAVIEFGDVQPMPTSPEKEDMVVDFEQARFVKYLYRSRFLKILDRLTEGSLESIFGEELEKLSPTATATPAGKGDASLGVLRLRGAELELRDETEVRLIFEDAVLGEMDLKVTDLRLWDDYRPKIDRIKRIQDEIEDCLITVGLTGVYESSSYPGPRHWLQVNNIYPRENPLWVRE